MPLTETMVRMGEYAIARSPDEVLASIGLGSCIGLAILEPGRPIAALAHVMLPDSGPAGRGTDTPGKFADTAVPALLAELDRRGARRTRLTVALVGGAQMFSLGGRTSAMDVGNRNREAVTQAVRAAGLRIAAQETGGNRGRTIRVYPDRGIVTSREAGGVETDILGSGRAV